MHTVTDYSTNRTLNVDHLRATAIAAEAAGFTAYNGGKDDGGSYNFDSAVLHLPTAWREQVTAALAGTGLHVYVDEWMCDRGETAFHVQSERTGGQGFARTRAAEAIQAAFKAAGYPGTTYYQMD